MATGRNILLICLATVLGVWSGCRGRDVESGLDSGAGMAVNGGASGGGSGIATNVGASSGGTGASGASIGGYGAVDTSGSGGADKAGVDSGPSNAALDGTAADSGNGNKGGSAGSSWTSDAADGDAVSYDWIPGDYPPDIAAETYLEISGVPGQGSYIRQYKVHVPPSYDSNVPMPVVFCIHGLFQTPVLFCVNGTDWVDKANEAGFILIMPNGYLNSWNGGSCCGAGSNEQLDDVALIRAILEEVGTHLNIDLDRVYATGLSNGGYLSYRLGCEAADIFAAVAPSAGAIGTNDLFSFIDPLSVSNVAMNSASDFSQCEPSQPISVLDIHGTADPLIPFQIQEPSLARMAEKNNCGTETAPAIDPESSGDTSCISYVGCPNGIEVIGCSVEGGGHCWFGSPDCGTGGGDIGLMFVGNNSNTMVNTDAVWDFFKRHLRSQ